jgi:hypothetical protein
MFYVNYVYTFVLKKVWDQFNESISDSGYFAHDFLKL